MAYTYMRIQDLDNNYLAMLLQTKHYILKIIWAICFLLMIVFCSYMVVLLVQDYMQSSSYNLVSISAATFYTLPAITICNINLLNKTSMDETQYNDEYTVYELYKNLYDTYKERSEGESSLDYTGIDTLDLYKRFKFDIEKNILPAFFKFAKYNVGYSEHVRFAYTEMGYCMEINDHRRLIQRVEGPTGGLSLVLDAMTRQYLDTTESQGFYVILRMPNERVVNKEFAFLVSPGEEIHVRLKTTDVTRLAEPWGTCLNSSDIFNPNTDADNDFLSRKECFLNQVLWLYMKTYECQCFPWYFWERFVDNENSEMYDDAMKSRLFNYWTQTVSAEKQLTFNSTCSEYVNNNVVYDGGLLSTVLNIADLGLCDAACRNTANCVVYLYSNATNSLLQDQECRMYSTETKLLTSDLDTTGVFRGQVNCTGNIGECKISTYSQCENVIIGKLMNEETEEQPEICHEPCKYSHYEYSMTRSAYPAHNYWENILKDQAVGSSYESYEEARRNLVKIVFYTEKMETIAATQTAAYELQNFVAELGGITDLFVGISFFTFFQLFEFAAGTLIRNFRLKRGLTARKTRASVISVNNVASADAKL